MNADIKTLIGEATAYDKKQQLEVKRPKSWLKSVSAFANGEGGTLVFGKLMRKRPRYCLLLVPLFPGSMFCLVNSLAGLLAGRF